MSTSAVDPDVAPPRPCAVLLVFSGGVLGTLVRFALEESVPLFRGVPAVTVVINVAGAFLLGALLGARPRKAYRLLAGTGFLGAFTTYSSLALDADLLFSSGRSFAGVVYLAATMLPGLAAAALGLALTRRTS